MWIGPRLRELVDRGTARPACGDCMVDAMKAGKFNPQGLVDMGNPEHHAP